MSMGNRGRRTRPRAAGGAQRVPAAPPSSGAAEVETVLSSLRRLSDDRIRDQMGPRYGIHLPDPKKAFGVRMAAMQKVAKDLGRNHDLALALWETGWYEARTVG